MTPSKLASLLSRYGNIPIMQAREIIERETTETIVGRIVKDGEAWNATVTFITGDNYKAMLDVEVK